MAKTTTLTDVAKALGVAPSTVQRALSGSPGVSDKRRAEIRKLAAEMGYQRNAMATLLKAPDRKIAVILPVKGYYSKELWAGVQQFFKENASFGFEILEYTYERTAETFAEILEKVYKEQSNSLSGVLTMGEAVPQAEEIFFHWKKGRIPVVFIGTDTKEGDRLCCWQGDDELSGKLAADLLLFSANPEANLKILITGDFSIADQYYNMQGFERSIMQRASRYEILKYGDKADADSVRANLSSYFKKHTDLTAVYSTSARNTVSMCQAAKDCGLEKKLRLIGSDLFPESRELLKTGELQAVIHKRPARQAYNAAQTLFNFVLHNTRPDRDVQKCEPVIIMQSNTGSEI